MYTEFDRDMQKIERQTQSFTHLWSSDKTDAIQSQFPCDAMPIEKVWFYWTKKLTYHIDEENDL